MQQEVPVTWSAKAWWRVPQAWLVILGCRQLKTCSLLLGQHLHLGLAKSSGGPLVQRLGLQLPAGGFLSLGHISPDPVSRAFYWVQCNITFGLGPTSSHRPGQQSSMGLGQAPPAVVACHWLLSPSVASESLWLRGEVGIEH